MHSRVEIVADVRDDGRPVLATLRADGALAVRATGGSTSRCEVHLVGTAAGPLGGDVIEVSVLVRAGATLALRGVAATLALPGRSAVPARTALDLVVEDGATLDHELPPLVVCRGARLDTTTHLALSGSARADVTEVVVLGRHGEPGGDWTGRFTADRAGLPVLRSTQRSAVLTGGPRAVRAGLPPGADRAVRAILTRLLTRVPDGPGRPAGPDGPGAPGRPVQVPAARTHGGAVACPLATGDVLVTAIGPDVSTVTSDARAARRGEPDRTGSGGTDAFEPPGANRRARTA